MHPMGRAAPSCSLAARIGGAAGPTRRPALYISADRLHPGIAGGSGCAAEGLQPALRRYLHAGIAGECTRWDARHRHVLWRLELVGRPGRPGDRLCIYQRIGFTPALREEVGAPLKVSNLRYGDIFMPGSLANAPDGTRGTVMFFGGSNWWGGRADPETGFVYISGSASPRHCGRKWVRR